MSDIIISGGGQTAVATDELLTSARSLAALSGRIDGWLAALRWESVSDITALSLGAQPDFGTDELLIASDDLARARRLADELAADLGRAAENYGRVERAAADVGEFAGALSGYELGVFAPILLTWLGGLLAAGAGGEALASVLFPDFARLSRRTLGALVSSQRALLSSPAVVAWVRMAVSSADEGMLGAAHVPLPLALGAGERGLGWFGLKGAAREIVGMANLGGALRETPVTVRRASVAPAAPPIGYADLAARVPPSRAGMPQVRIEKYQVAGSRPRWIVYVGGTLDTGFTAGGEPFDDTSNLQGIAQLDPGSVRAAKKAMRAAGARPGDRVLSVGYSQGGIVATDIVTDGGYRNAGLVTFGSPTGQVAVPHDVPDVAVEVTEDMVPALGGYPRPAGRGGLDRILVRHSAYDGGPVPASELAASALPAHNIRHYRDTAELMDASTDPRLTRMRDAVAAVTGGSQATATTWRADRIAPSAP